MGKEACNIPASLLFNLPMLWQEHPAWATIIWPVNHQQRYLSLTFPSCVCTSMCTSTCNLLCAFINNIILLWPSADFLISRINIILESRMKVFFQWEITLNIILETLREPNSQVHPLIPISQSTRPSDKHYDSYGARVGDTPWRVIKIGRRNKKLRYEIILKYHISNIKYRQSIKMSFFSSIFSKKKEHVYFFQCFFDGCFPGIIWKPSTAIRQWKKTLVELFYGYIGETGWFYAIARYPFVKGHQINDCWPIPATTCLVVCVVRGYEASRCLTGA